MFKTDTFAIEQIKFLTTIKLDTFSQFFIIYIFANEAS